MRSGVNPEWSQAEVAEFGGTRLSATGIAGGMDDAFDADRYDGRMPYRRCGRSGLMLPAMSLGAYETLGGYRDEATSRAILTRAFDRGITHIDFANNYGTPPGNAEIVCGQILRDFPRDELVISSKAGWRMWPGPYGDFLGKKYLIASCEQSLRRLGVEYLDIFYLHRTDPDTPLEESLGALDQLIRQGKALYGGVSGFSGAHFAEAVRICQRDALSRIAIHQPGYNLLDRRIEADLIPHLERTGVGAIPFVPLAQGLLSDRYLAGEIPADSRATHRWGTDGTRRRLTPQRLTQLRGLNDIALARGQTLSQMALQWILRLPVVTSVLVGVSSLAQLDQNLGALKGPPFSDDELAGIDALTAPSP